VDSALLHLPVRAAHNSRSKLSDPRSPALLGTILKGCLPASLRPIWTTRRQRRRLERELPLRIVPGSAGLPRIASAASGVGEQRDGQGGEELIHCQANLSPTTRSSPSMHRAACRWAGGPGTGTKVLAKRRRRAGLPSSSPATSLGATTTAIWPSGPMRAKPAGSRRAGLPGPARRSRLREHIPAAPSAPAAPHGQEPA